MKSLFITPHLKWPLTFGGDIRKWNILQGLLAAGPVDVVVCGSDDLSLSERSYAGCDHIILFPSRFFNMTQGQKRLYDSTIGRGLLIVSSALPYSFLGGNWLSARERFRSMIRPVQYSLIWVETLRLGVALDVPGVAGAVNAVLDGDDFAWMRDRDVLRTSPAYGAKVFNYLDLLKTWSWEKTCSKDYSCVIRCSLEDAERQGSKNVVVVPNGAVVPDCVRRVPEERVLFVGVLWYEPNSLGVEWFLSYVWPLVHQEVPTVHLDIVGNGPSERILSANGRLGVTVHGFVEELESLYERATLSVVPLHAGGGTRLKVLEALGRGVPVVSTSIGAYGIPLGDSHGLLRRDGVRAFAGACIELLRNKEHDLQRAALMGRESVSKAFQWKNIRAVPTFSEENQLVGVAG